ncbi:MAG: hypothetical protein HY094_05635 [Candidatus Melainabacteria bacterium]|nr:hypothetical protein [Candidatus Melainabacteria bacterium]
MKTYKLRFSLIFLFVILIFFFLQNKIISKEYSDFATPDELIDKYQVLLMPWQKLNGPFGGQGYTIRFSPNDSNKIIVTDSFAGIHISGDRGLTWDESTQGIDSRAGESGDAIPVFVTTIDPNNPQRIWCGVKNAMGVFLSTDGGATWQHKDNGLPSGEEVEIRGLAVKPGDSNTVFASGDLEEIGPFMGAFQRTHGILYRTTDGGENWAQVLSGGNLFKDVIIDPNNPNTTYVASGFFDRQQLEKLEGVYKSTDSGSTWAQINNGIRNLYVTNIKFDPMNPNTIWGTTGMIPQFDTDIENQDGAIIVTRDSGMTWIEVKRQRSNGSPQLYSALGISPTNPNVIYAGAFGIFFKSKDGGMTWTETGFGPLGSNPGHPIDIAVDPNDENTVYVDSYIGGVFKTTDGGKTWVTNAFGYSGSETRDVAVSPDGNKVFATSRSGVFLSEDKGVNWLPVGLGDVALDELQAIVPHPADSSKVLLGDSQNAMSSIFLSTDGGMSWRTVFMLFPEDYALHPSSTGLDGEIVFTDIKWAKSNPSTAFATCVKKSLFHDAVDSIGWGVFKSTDGGMTWINKQTGISGFKNTWSCDVSPTDEKIVYAATNDSGIIKSTDGGETWTQINNGLGDVKSFHSVSVCPANTQVILVGSSDGRIFRSSDAGSTWQPVLSNENHLNDNIVSIIFNPISSTHQVYAAGNVTGFYVSGDDGQTWQSFSNGLLIREVRGLTVTPDGSAVYAATNGGGIFRLPIVGDSLTLTRKQIEPPSNAGIDASNNKNTVSSSSTSSSTGGNTSSGEPVSFSLAIEGPALSGLTLLQKKPAKSFLIVSFDQNLFNTSLEDSLINITTDLPKKALVIAPNKFPLTAKDSSKKVHLIVLPIKKLEKIKEIAELFPNGFPEKISLTVTQITQGMSFSKDIEIPLSR